MLIAVIASALVVFGSPYVGQIRGAVQSAFPSSYRLIILATIGVALLAAMCVAIVRIRERYLARYAALAAAAIGGLIYAIAVSTGDPSVDAVERFHFVEYGLLTFLYYRAWRDHVDLSAMVLPVCATVIVAVADEGVQWYIPSRVGELHDVLLNLAAILCGVLFSIGIDPPRSMTVPATRIARVRLGAAIAAAILAVAIFVDRVHLGYEVGTTDGSVFHSQFEATELRARAVQRAHVWGSRRPATAKGLAREDHYLTEGEWHVQRRNVAEAGHDARMAWNENLILEQYFQPVLTIDGRWTEGQRQDIRATVLNDNQPYVSAAELYPIYAIPRGWFWSAMGLLLAAIGIVTRASAARATGPAR